MKKTGLSIILGSVFLFASASSQAATLEVCGQCQYQSIANAVAAANTNDTVYIHNGTYNEHDILVEREISIVGQSQNNTIIDAQGNGRHFNILNTSDAIGIGPISLINGDASNTNSVCGSFTSGRGGSICADGIALKIWKTTFNNNQSGDLGGAIYIRGDNSTNGWLSVTKSRFTNNFVVGTVSNGDTGGAITCSYCDEVVLFKNTFKSNTAVPSPIPNDPYAGNGGAVGAYGVNYFESQMNTYSKNYSGGTGGAIYLRLNYQENAMGKIVNDTMAYNSAQSNGGAISNASYQGSLSIAL